MGFYVTDQTRDSLLNYRYHGEDRSLLYRYVLNPIAMRLVEFIPVWVAPNTITVIGLVMLSISAAITYLESPDLTGPLPDPVYKLCALSILLYQTLDNLDGKQARRIGNSTPLGLLMDHGVDALAVTITTLILAAVFQTGSGMPLFVLWLMGMIPFTFATWEEYHTGHLVLGILNGPSDGLALAVLCCLLPVRFGSDFWITPIKNSVGFHPDWAYIPRYRFVILFLIVALVFTVCANIYNVIRHRQQQSKSVIGPFKTLGPFAILLSAAFVWLQYSPSNILATNPRWCLFIIGFIFANLACKLMLAHLGNHRYRVRRYSLVPLVLAAANSLLGAPFNETATTLITLAVAIACWLHFVLIAGWEVTEILGIRVFVVKPAVKTA